MRIPNRIVQRIRWKAKLKELMRCILSRRRKEEKSMNSKPAIHAPSTHSRIKLGAKNEVADV
jgi:hypothetical protein